MNDDRATDSAAALCACPRPLRETTHSCTRCGRDLGTSKFTLSPQARAMAELIAEHVVELQEQNQSRQKPSRARRREQEQLELGG